MKTGAQTKCVTFSFDDGNVDDIRLVELLNRYGLKGTFNLNAAHLSYADCWRFRDVKDVHHINYTEHPHLYDGHEIAGHSYGHPRLELLDEKTLENEIQLDQKLLKCLYGCHIRGMIYPFGSYSPAVMDALQKNGIEYARTTQSTHSFFMPADFLEWHPTCHFGDEALEELAGRFLADQSGEFMTLYVWGHSYELVTKRDWDRLEAFCRKIAGHKDVFYGTNAQVLDRYRDR